MGAVPPPEPRWEAAALCCMVGGSVPVSPPPPGVRMISLSYSRISLADIAQKLQLDSPEDAEFIVAKVAVQEASSLCLPGLPTTPARPLLPRPQRAPFPGLLISGCAALGVLRAPTPISVHSLSPPLPAPSFALNCCLHPGRWWCPDHAPRGSQAIRDGVIEASINHEKGYVQSKEMIDIYSTREPQLAFHQRISFCLDIHNMSVKVSTAQLCEDPGGGLGGHGDGAEGGSGSAQAAVELL